MSTDKANFRRALRDVISEFRFNEEKLRASYAGEHPEGPVLPEELLERPTRRFLIDKILKILDWDADDPTQIDEEARSRNRDTWTPLFFDYLGRAQDKAPALLVEAKRLDSEPPRRPNEQVPFPKEMARLISHELGRLKGSGQAQELTAQWARWLNDLVIYVKSMSPEDQQRLARVAITAGRWLIVFKTPYAAFVHGGAPDPECIICYRSFDEMEASSDDIFDLLSRDRLVDTLPLTMRLGEALAVLEPSDIRAMYRGVVVSTQIVGAKKDEFPLRSVLPAIVFASRDRVFAVTRYGAHDRLSEPNVPERLETFLQRLDEQGNEFLALVLNRFGRTDLQPRPVEEFSVLLKGAVHAPAPGSAAALIAGTQATRMSVVVETGERGAALEFLVVTGTSWFYKLNAPVGKECHLHFYPRAKADGVAGAKIGLRGAISSFTGSGEVHHCEDEPLRGKRAARCHLGPLESHMCCKACVFNPGCWNAEESRTLPCPK